MPEQPIHPPRPVPPPAAPFGQPEPYPVEPQRVLPVRAIPVQAVHQQFPPMPPPMSAATMPPSFGYSRPALITAIGITSLIVAAISGIASVTMGFTSIVFFAVSKIPTPPAVALTPPTGNVVPSGPTVGPRGLNPAQRRIVINGLKRQQPLTPARTKLLDALLADSGEDILPFRGTVLTERNVAS